MMAMCYSVDKHCTFTSSPAGSDSAEGKRRLRTVAVRIRKAQNNLRNKHQGVDFTFAIEIHA